MKLRELIGVKKYKDETAEDVMELLAKDFNMKIIGSGTFGTVLQSNDPNIVYKVFEHDDAYMKFISFIAQHPNKHYPTVFKIKHLHSFYKRKLADYDKFIIVKTEKLYKITDENLNQFVAEFLHSMKYSPKVIGDQLPPYTMDRNKNTTITYKQYFEKMPWLISLYMAAWNLYTSVTATWDIADNIMQRKDGTLVIIDPFYDDEEIDRKFSSDNKRNYFTFKSGPIYKENKAYHSGDLSYGKDTTLGRMIGSRSTGHFGTGVYFVSDKSKIGGTRADRPMHEIDLSKYNLAKPSSARDAELLHDGLKTVNQLTHLISDGKDWNDNNIKLLLRKAAFNIYISLMRDGNGKIMNSDNLEIIIKNTINKIAPSFNDVANLSEYHQTAATHVMKLLGFEGIDVTHIPEFDNTTYGTVIYTDKIQNISEMYDDDDEEPDYSNLPSIKLETQLRPLLSKVAQQEYDEWDAENIDEYAGGGICHFIADKFCEVLNKFNIDCGSVTSSHEQHVYVIAKFKEGVYSIDLHYSYYETGAGFSWKKIPNVVMYPNDIDFYRITSDPGEFDQYIDSWE